VTRHQQREGSGTQGPQAGEGRLSSIGNSIAATCGSGRGIIMSAEGRMGGGQRRQRSRRSGRSLFCGAGGGSERSSGWLITAALLVVTIGGAAAEQFHPNKSTTFINKEQLFKVPLPFSQTRHARSCTPSPEKSLVQSSTIPDPYPLSPALSIPA
jgi:hypothetical protein